MDYIDSVLGLQGLLAQHVPGYQPRQGQIDMARGIMKTVCSGGIALIDAPTGVGKSFAYLTPALGHIYSNKLRVMVVTSNITLQEQLYKKDVPTLTGMLHPECKYALIKGRANYWCKRRAFAPNFSKLRKGVAAAQAQYDRLRIWIAASETGDRSEAPEHVSDALWNQLSSSPENCLGKACVYQGDCFYELAKRRTWAAKLVITNYAMFLRSLQAAEEGKNILGPAGVVILDEAHELPDKARDCFGFSLSMFTVEQLAKWAKGASASELAQDLHADGAALFAHVKTLYRQLGNDTRLRPDWSKGKAAGLLDSLQHVAAVADTVINRTGVDAGKAKEAALAARKALKFRFNLAQAVKLENSDAAAYWLEEAPRDVRIMSKPIFVSRQLQRMLFKNEDIKTVCCTSATLAVGKSFDYFKEQCGIDRATVELCVASPFDMTRQARLIVPNVQELPLPDYRNAKAFQLAVGDAIAHIISATGGSALCLFTSWTGLKTAHEKLTKEYSFPFKILAQSKGCSRSALIEEFKSDVSSCLLGVASFWQGVDIPGEALSTLIIDKIPFPSPSDPLEAAISDMLKRRKQNAFMLRSVPEAQLRIKQGLGRLIRTTSDTGLIVILDTRIRTKWTSWGRRMLLPLDGIPCAASLYEAEAAIGQLQIPAQPFQGMLQPAPAAGPHSTL